MHLTIDDTANSFISNINIPQLPKKQKQTKNPTTKKYMYFKAKAQAVLC